METRPQFSTLLDSESFGEGASTYFIDIKKTCLNTPFLQITRSDGSGEKYVRSNVIIFEQDLPFFVEALTMVLGRLTAGQIIIH